MVDLGVEIRKHNKKKRGRGKGYQIFVGGKNENPLGYL